MTNTGNIYKIDITNPTTIESSQPTLWSNITGANGLLINGNTMYVASYPADGTTTDNNVIYVIDDITTPNPQKLIQKSGQYDGLALSKDSKWLYASNWSPTDISIDNKTLFIPDLVNSLVIMKDISKYSVKQ